MPADQQWDVWFDILKESPVPRDPVVFARNISSGLPTGQRLIQHVTVARRLAKDDRNDDTSQVLRLGLDAAEQDETSIKFLVCITAAEVALSAGDRKLAAKAVRISIGAAMAEQVPALALSCALVVWHKQLGDGPLGE
jgi:hypothetical protein